MGTHPTLFTASPPDSREVIYEQTDAELAKLSANIKASQASAGHSPMVPGVSGQDSLRGDVTMSVSRVSAAGHGGSGAHGGGHGVTDHLLPPHQGPGVHGHGGSGASVATFRNILHSDWQLQSQAARFPL